jgi:hypothetical protein
MDWRSLDMVVEARGKVIFEPEKVVVYIDGCGFEV